MQRFTDWQQCVDLCRQILHSPPGDWTHEINGKPVRMVRRVIQPDGSERVYFRGEHDGGSWGARAWDEDALPIIPEQLTLF